MCPYCVGRGLIVSRDSERVTGTKLSQYSSTQTRASGHQVHLHSDSGCVISVSCLCDINASRTYALTCHCKRPVPFWHRKLRCEGVGNVRVQPQRVVIRRAFHKLQ